MNGSNSNRKPITVVLDNVNMADMSNFSTKGGCPIALGSYAVMDLYISGTNVLEAPGTGKTGLYAPTNTKLTIYDGTTIDLPAGTLTAAGSTNGLGNGIGGYDGASCGDITIKSGTILAYSNKGGTGYGAGIGSGYTLDTNGVADASVTIKGSAQVTAYSGVGETYGAGIGGSYLAGNGGGSITIAESAQVNAWSSKDNQDGGIAYGNGIGGGAAAANSSETPRGGAGGTIAISGGTVFARSGKNDNQSAGYGVGQGAYADTTAALATKIVLTGGSVNAPLMSSLTGEYAVLPVNASDDDVFLLTTTISGKKNAAVTALTGFGSYGVTGINTDADSKVYLWLPAGSLTKLSATAGGTTFTAPSATVVAFSNNELLFGGDVTAISASANSASAAGASVTLTLTGTNLNVGNVYIGRFVGGEYKQSWTVSSNTLAVGIPENESASPVTHTFKVSLDKGKTWLNSPTASVAQAVGGASEVSLAFTRNLPIMVAPGRDEGHTVLQVAASGAVGYQWYKDGAPIAGATGNDLTLHKAGGDGRYYVVASGADGQTIQSYTCLVQWSEGLGTVIANVQQQYGAPDATVTDPQAFVNAALTQAEKDEVFNNANVRFEVTLLIVGAAENAVAKQKAEAEGYTVGMYLDISVAKEKFVGNASQGGILVPTLSDSVRIVLTIPQTLRANNRTFAMVHVHDNTATLLRDLDSEAATVTVETASFSPYALVYRDGTSPNTGDASNMGLWVAVLAICACAMLALLVVQRRKASSAAGRQ